MNKPGRVLILIMMLSGLSIYARGAECARIPDPIPPTDTIYFSRSGDGSFTLQVPAKADETGKKKFVSALFAFPFPFGFMGAHRVMLGTKPWVPVVYVASFGGCFGLLPLIDFFVITFSKDISKYENNPHIFMWVE